MRKLLTPSALLLTLALGLSTFPLAGCDTKEEVLDIETPGGSVEVNRDRSSGDVEVDVDKDE